MQTNSFISFPVENSYMAYVTKTDSSATYPLDLHIIVPDNDSKRVYLECRWWGIATTTTFEFRSSVATSSTGATLTTFCMDGNSSNSASTLTYLGPTLSNTGTLEFTEGMQGSQRVNYRFPFAKDTRFTLEQGNQYDLRLTPSSGSQECKIGIHLYED